MKHLSSSRRGSALLIVLGILSFMVVSAVAFSVLMRQSRLPSSFMRQKVASAQLVKAGLANAMAEVDRAIGDNPYPGVGTLDSWSADGTTYGNYWHNGRIFLKANGIDSASDTGSGAQAADVDEQEGAVSTMPFEGLAYLPPPLVNAVRYWMKRSPTAVWQTLGYDSGRFAYTAINVSDYLDVNRLKANVMRDSSSSNRISIAYLFEDASHTSDGTVSPEAFDNFIGQVSQNLNTRLVSMADYALAIGSGQFGASSFASPFYDYVKNGGGASMYTGDLESIRMQKFITDSWYPGSVTNSQQRALTDNANQPFATFDAGFDSLLRNSPGEILKHLNFPERVALKDYLDDDNVPTSLALPTMEYAPMLTGIQITPDRDTFKFKVEQDPNDVVTPEVKNAQGAVTTPKITKRLWKITGFDGTPQIGASMTAVFPFKRTSAKLIGDRTSYPVQLLVKAFLVPDGSETEKTRLDDGAFSCRPTTEQEWKTAQELGSSSYPCLYFRGMGSADLKSGGNAQTESEATISINAVMASLNASTFTCPIYGVSVSEYSDSSKATEVVYDSSRFGEVAEQVKFVDLKSSGGQSFKDQDGKKFRWQFFAWVRILGDDNKTVDLFPASIQDDKVYNGIDQGPVGSSPTMVGESAREGVLPIKGPLALDLQQATFIDASAPSPLTVGAPAAMATAGFNADVDPVVKIYCDDPRYNWAPEDWYAASGGISPDTWLSSAKAQLNGADCRSRDIFQFVSNQGYLQSLGELQFLPLVRNSWGDVSLSNPVSASFCNDGGSRYNGEPFANRTGPGNLANRAYMWKTYTFFPDRGSWDDDTYDPYNWGLVDSIGGAVVSPYADGDLFMAAIANTPYDYAIASEPEDGQKKFNSLAEGRKYCFNAFSSEARVEWTTLEDIAEQLRTKCRSGDDWWDYDAWNSETGDTLFGQSVGCSIHDVDRKFLASYWRSCFGNSQQLFLIFVRAEPTVMGAAATGHTPSQLGARAVALVWREPTSTVNASESPAPHRMRILFYHQFD